MDEIGSVAGHAGLLFVFFVVMVVSLVSYMAFLARSDLNRKRAERERESLRGPLLSLAEGKCYKCKVECGRFLSKTVSCS